jgi:hypothetical protein
MESAHLSQAVVHLNRIVPFCSAFGHGLRAVVDVELLEDVGDVRLDGALADVEFACNLLVGSSSRPQP